MQRLTFIGSAGDFVLEDADRDAGLYFPLVNEGGMISSVTPRLAGDCKTGQNTFLLAPASPETLHESRASRNFFLRVNGRLWSAAGQSAAQQAARFGGDAESVTVRAGLLYHTVTRRSAALGVEAEITSLVPAGADTVELMRVTVRNLSDRPLSLVPTAVLPLFGRSADNLRDHRHVTSLLQRLRVTERGVTLTQTLTFDERGHRPGNVRYTVLGADDAGRAPVRFLARADQLCGAAGSYDWPEALVKPNGVKWLHAGDKAEGYEMAATLQFEEEALAPNAEKSWFLALGVDCAGEGYLSPDAFESALQATRRWWSEQTAAVFSSGDAETDAWLRWVGAQPTLRRICGCSFLPHHDYGRGGRGWRDLWQDSLALLLDNPRAVRDDLVRYFAGVRADGTNATIIGRSAGEFLADRNHIVRIWMDHGYWPLVTTALYVRQTGDLSILTEKQPYFCDARKERGSRLTDAPAEAVLTHDGAPVLATVLEHLLIENVTAFFDAGAHGCIRLRGADWNDALDMAAENGESVAFTAAYAGNLKELASLCRALARSGREVTALSADFAELLLASEDAWAAPEARNAARERYERVCEARPLGDRDVSLTQIAAKLDGMSRFLTALLRRQEFVTDGADQTWMNSYYDNLGHQVEGVSNGRVRMMLTGQVFALMGGVADEKQAAAISRAADWYLDSPLRGGYCLNTDFGQDAPPLGRQFGFAYGHKENGAVFCHMAVMYAFALYRRRMPEKGMRVLSSLRGQCARFSASRVYPGIPEYFDPEGRGMYPYLTGAASWLMYALLTEVYGVRGDMGDLVLDPQLPPDWFDAANEAAVVCRFAEHRVTVRYHNPERLAPKDAFAACATFAGRTLRAGSEGLRIARDALTEDVVIDVTLARA